MIPLTLERVAALAGGTLSPEADAAAVISGPVVADSRRVELGSLFVAVPGERVDGHEFAAAAVGAGAVALLASRPVGVPAVLVDDTVLGLGRLAREYLRVIAPTVVSVTGSSGKTSTKDLLAHVLSQVAATVAPEGSFNTEVGVPLTVLRADADTRFLVLENSARGIGHIAYLCGIAPPAVGIVLNVGAAHIGEFGSREAVAQAKGELVEALPPEGLAVLNADDPLVAAMRSRTVARARTFGLADTSPDADVRASQVTLDDLARARFRLETPAGATDVKLALHGAHHVYNALAVAAAALELGMSIETIGDALRIASPLSRWRMEVAARPDGVTVVNDAYNANPESMRAALAALATMRPAAGGRRWAVLGEMAELGAMAAPEHLSLGAEAAARVDRLVVVGAGAAGIADGAIEAGLPASGVARVADVDDALSLLDAELAPGDIVLVKASRSARLERVAAGLLDAGIGSGASA